MLPLLPGGESPVDGEEAEHRTGSLMKELARQPPKDAQRDHRGTPERGKQMSHMLTQVYTAREGYRAALAQPEGQVTGGNRHWTWVLYPERHRPRIGEVLRPSGGDALATRRPYETAATRVGTRHQRHRLGVRANCRSDIGGSRSRLRHRAEA